MNDDHEKEEMVDVAFWDDEGGFGTVLLPKEHVEHGEDEVCSFCKDL